MLIFLAVATLLVVSRQAVSDPAPPPSSPTLVVGTCLGASPYTTIQSAVTAAPSGGTVLVCPGTYPEQVTITQPLTLKGVQVGNMDAAVITSPITGVVPNSTNAVGTPVAAQILVEDTTGVNISNLTVDGSGNGISSPCSGPWLAGIFYNTASGKVEDVATRNQTPACGTGIGIYGVAEGGESANLEILNNSVHSYSAAGIVMNRPGLKVTIEGNSVAGIGLAGLITEYGIQVAFGAVGKVQGNTVVDNVAPNTSIGPDAGILVAYSSGVVVANNSVGNTNNGIVTQSGPIQGPADHTAIVGNTILATHNPGYTSGVGDGIDVCSNSNFISGNTVFASDESAIHLDGTCTSTGNNNVVKENRMNEACAGILEDIGTTGNATGFGNLFFNDVNTILHADGCTPGVFSDPRAAGAESSARSRINPY
jgi:hypothetical protein